MMKQATFHEIVFWDNEYEYHSNSKQLIYSKYYHILKPTLSNNAMSVMLFVS